MYFVEVCDKVTDYSGPKVYLQQTERMTGSCSHKLTFYHKLMLINVKNFTV